MLSGRGKVLTVVGAGGNRDKGKRPVMAQEAAKGSDRVIITSDNPRIEELNDIIYDTLAGLNSDQRINVLPITDRKEAIRSACMVSVPGAWLLVPGIGPGNYPVVSGLHAPLDH